MILMSRMPIWPVSRAVRLIMARAAPAAAAASRLALDRDGGLIQLVPACRRPDQGMPAGKRHRVLERPPPLIGQRRIQLRGHADGERVRAQLSRRTQPVSRRTPPATRRPRPCPRHRAGQAGPGVQLRPFTATAPRSSLAGDRKEARAAARRPAWPCGPGRHPPYPAAPSPHRL